MSSSEAGGEAARKTVRPEDPGRVWYHFAGIGGSGMSGLAQFHALAGGRATGSDRAFDQGERRRIREQLTALGIGLCPQDGSGLGPDCRALIVSTAVEDSIPDVRTAKQMGIAIWHRSELLARYVARHRTVAVTGTSGKSTVVALTFSILQAAGLDPSLLTGGNLVALAERGLPGNAWAGRGDLLVIEADESDGSLVRYRPWAGVLLNLRKDHKEPAELAGIFDTFRRRTAGPFLVGEDENLAPFAGGAVRFGLGAGCDVRAERIDLQADRSEFTVDGVRFELPLPGAHNVRNAVAAIATCQAAGVPLAGMVKPLARFAGVTRRFQSIGRAGGVEVIDDFAHNPDKIGAALAAARGRGERILAVFQPHGFGPTRFLRDDLIAAFGESLTPQDRLWMPEIFYAGGTVSRDVSSQDLIAGIKKHGVPAYYIERRADITAAVAAEARAGDVIIVMGARDPSLTDFCRAILAELQARLAP